MLFRTYGQAVLTLHERHSSLLIAVRPPGNNFICMQADNGESALAVTRREHFDLIICDWMMPTLSGLDVLKGIRSMNTRVPFLMLTAKASTDAIVAAKKAGVTSYIVKPFTRIDLRTKILLLVDKGRP